MFASPSQLGRLPWSYDQVWRVYQEAATAAGIGRLGTHSVRHTYRSLLDSVGTRLAVQLKLMRHTDIRTTIIRTTMNVYGDVITNHESEALAKIARLALANSTQQHAAPPKLLKSGERGRFKPSTYRLRVG
jgi:integrase